MTAFHSAAVRRVAPRQEPEEAPKRKKRASAEKRRAAEQPGDKDELLNKMILGAGAVLLVAVAAALFLFARNEGLIPGGRPAQSEAGLTEAEEAEEPAPVVAGESEEEALINEEPLGRLKVTAGTLNIRNGASTQGTQIIGKAKKGEVYPYLSEENGWFFIDLGGGEGGYVNEEFVEKE